MLLERIPRSCLLALVVAAALMLSCGSALAQDARLPTPAERAWLAERLSSLGSSVSNRREAELGFLELSRDIESRHADEPLVELALRVELVSMAVSAGLLSRAVVEVSELDELALRSGDARAVGLLRATTVSTARALIGSGNPGAARGLFRREVYRDGIGRAEADRVRLAWAMAELQSGAPAGARIALRLADQVRDRSRRAGRDGLATVAAWIGVMASEDEAEDRYRETLDASPEVPGTRAGAIFPLAAGVLAGVDTDLVEGAADRLLAFEGRSDAIGAMDLIAGAALLAQREPLLGAAERLVSRAIERAAGDEGLLELARITRSKIAVRRGSATPEDEAASDVSLSLEFSWGYADGPSAEAPRVDPEPELIFRVVREDP